MPRAKHISRRHEWGMSLMPSSSIFSHFSFKPGGDSLLFHCTLDDADSFDILSVHTMSTHQQVRVEEWM